MEQLTLDMAVKAVEEKVLTEKRATAKRINVNAVGKVYSGRPGCMCGCRGKYTAATKHLEWANKDRGYPYLSAAGEVSDRSVAVIVNKMNKFAELLEWADDGQYAYLELDGRIYCAYFAGYDRRVVKA